jgi:tRNA threonylcarbamoyladenosine biosynthesis protein TsaE
MATIISRSADETFKLGRDVAESLRNGDVLAFDGELGAGKTHFVKGLAAGLGSSEEVVSPTFTLVREYYGGRLPLYHFDFYRVEDGGAALGIGFDEYLEEGGVAAIEWAGKFAELIPQHARWIYFRHLADGTREIQMQ